jgi:hypothetical protein
MLTAERLSAPPVARDLLAALAAWDEPRLRSLLADDVWMRALLVRETVESHDAESAMRALHGWYGSAVELQVLNATTYRVATREQITFRVRVRPPWAPETWHLIEQTAYLRIADGRIRRFDLICTGFHPVP